MYHKRLTGYAAIDYQVAVDTLVQMGVLVCCMEGTHQKRTVTWANLLTKPPLFSR